MLKLAHKHTLYACCVGYITQAIVNNLMPLLFATFATAYGISLDKIGLLITINFVIQMAVDFTAAKYVSKVGYRSLIVLAHFAATSGLICLSLAPIISPNNIYPMLMTSVVIYAVGGGLIEVLVSPMVEALPIENKAGTMSLLHSFYCWGQVCVTLLSTLYFVTVGIEKWIYLPVIWAIIPFLNAFAFIKVPVYVFDEETTGSQKMRELFKSRLFWIFVILMVGAGASELAMAQWSSYFAEMGLRVSKTVGDLLGPCMFAVLMGIARVLYSRLSTKVDLAKTLTASSFLCIFCYLLATLSPYPMVSIIGCALCGFSVGIMWPGVYSLAAKTYAKGGTMMFALLALAGDVGCSAGASIVGYVSDAIGGTETAIKIGLLTIAVFPLVMVILIGKLKRYVNTNE